MAKARKILRRLKSIRNIRAVTRAMYMISTARFKQAHDRLLAARPFLTGLTDLATDVLSSAPPDEAPHPLMMPGAAGAPRVVIVIASRRGLCGSFNNAIADRAARHIQELRKGGTPVSVRGSGKRGQLILEARDCPVEKAYPQFDRTPDLAVVRSMADELMKEFLDGAVSGVEVACTRFISAGQQKPDIVQVLPMEGLAAGLAPSRKETAEKKEETRGQDARDKRGQDALATKVATRWLVPPTFLPGREAVVRSLIPEAVRAKLFQCFLDASVSEHVARMTAMRYASDNAEDLIHDLTVMYNRARQSQITMELAEIMGGREGVEGM
jgi:F-type H+-transporting ATPase subunit gamma